MASFRPTNTGTNESATAEQTPAQGGINLSNAPTTTQTTTTQNGSVGHLTLRGHHEPTTSLYEDLDKKGVSFNISALAVSSVLWHRG